MQSEKYEKIIKFCNDFNIIDLNLDEFMNNAKRISLSKISKFNYIKN